MRLTSRSILYGVHRIFHLFANCDLYKRLGLGGRWSIKILQRARRFERNSGLYFMPDFTRNVLHHMPHVRLNLRSYTTVLSPHRAYILDVNHWTGVRSSMEKLRFLVPPTLFHYSVLLATESQGDVMLSPYETATYDRAVRLIPCLEVAGA